MKQELPADVRHWLADIGATGGAKSKGGGRPPIADDKRTPEQRKRHERYEKWKQKQSEK